MKIKITLLIILLSTNLLAIGNKTFTFLSNDVSARSAALGGNTIILADDPNIIFYNPASIIRVLSQQVSFGYFKHLLDINSGHLSYAKFIEDFGYIGAGVIYTNYGEFEKRNEFGDVLGSFSANDVSISVAYGNILYKNISYGTTLKFIYSNIDKYSSSAIAIDLGALYTITPEKFYLAVSLTNLGTQIDPYIHTRENLPLDLIIGTTLKPEHLPLVLNFSISKLFTSRKEFISHFRAFNLGGEFTINPNLFFRFGYNNDKRQDLKIGNTAGLAGFSIGLGLKLEQYKLDYAYNSLGKAGGFHRVTLGLLFD